VQTMVRMATPLLWPAAGEPVC